MKYRVHFSNRSLKYLRKLDKQIAQKILRWIKVNLDNCDNPRMYGKNLDGQFEGCWRYRIGNYRVIARIEDDKLKIIVLKLGHRR